MVGYGENLVVPTIDVISAEINVIGNLVGSDNDLVEPLRSTMPLATTCHHQRSEAAR